MERRRNTKPHLVPKDFNPPSKRNLFNFLLQWLLFLRLISWAFGINAEQAERYIFCWSKHFCKENSAYCTLKQEKEQLHNQFWQMKTNTDWQREGQSSINNITDNLRDTHFVFWVKILLNCFDNARYMQDYYMAWQTMLNCEWYSKTNWDILWSHLRWTS